MYCRQCGFKLPEGATTCPMCGTQVNAAVLAAAQTAASTVQGQTAGQGVYATPQNAMPSGSYSYGTTYQRPAKKNHGCLVAVIIVIALLLLTLGGMVALFALTTEDGVGYAPPSDSGTVTEYGAAGVTGQDSALTADARPNYTQIKGDGTDTYTLLIYMVGSDLESEDGSASADIKEMMRNDLGENVKIVIQTGGARHWQMNQIDDGGTQRWALENGELVELADLGRTRMLTEESLSDFLAFGIQNYPANRYGLVLWDHGGGSLYGYGYDELNKNDYLSLLDIAGALESCGQKFDFIGFDACLMGSIEAAYALEPYADYMIASEETEPGYGWNYYRFLGWLAENTSCDTVELGTHIVDDFVLQNQKTDTLSVIALAKIPAVYNALCTFMQTATEELDAEGFTALTAGRVKTLSFADGEYDMVDIIDMAECSGVSGSGELTEAVQSAVAYANKSATAGAHGLSMYYPYSDLTVYDTAKETFSVMGFGGPVYGFFDKFVNLMAGAQDNFNGNTLYGELTGEDAPPAQENPSTAPGGSQGASGESYGHFQWYDQNTAEGYNYDTVDYEELQVEWSDAADDYIVPMTNEKWDLVNEIQLQVLLDDGEGYVDLGRDQYFDTDDEDNLLMDFDNTWIAIDGQVVPYYAEKRVKTEDGYSFLGYVPAELNGETDIEIMLQWDSTDADAGYIAGYRLIGETDTLGKGWRTFNRGDTIDFVCDYYTYDGEYDASYYYGDQITIGRSLPKVTYEDLGDGPILMSYLIVDIYNNYAWTETVEYSY